jgi:hypothetical protein
MTQTPDSSLVPYATPQQALQFLDVRQVGDLISDQGIRVQPAQIVGDMTHPPDPNFLAALEAASGEVESACLVSQRYRPADLQALIGVSAVMLQKIVARLAMADLHWRRYPDKDLPAAGVWAHDMLQKLRDGHRIFGTLEAEAAGNLEQQFLDLGTIQTVNLSTLQTQRYFGVRGDVNRLNQNPDGNWWW